MKMKREYLILGYGVSGHDAARLLSMNDIKFTVMDDNPERITTAEALWLKTHGEGIVNADKAAELIQNNAVECVITSPGVAKTHCVLQAAQHSGIAILSELSFAAGFLSGKKIGITGTNGKTSTVHMLYEVLNRQHVVAVKAGNIGNSLSGEAVKMPQSEAYVIEISSFQLEFADTLELEGAIITNIAPDHLGRYKNYEDYIQTKFSILNRVKKNGFAVMPYAVWKSYNPPITKDIRCYLVGEQKKQGMEITADVDGIWMLENNRSKCMLGKNDMKFLGLHMYTNAALVLAANKCMGRDNDCAVDAVRNFNGLPHRIEWVASYNGVNFYNDSKATNPDASERALECFLDKSVVLILGGQDKKCSLEGLKNLICRCVKHLVLIGESKPIYQQYFNGIVPYDCADTLEEAVWSAYGHAKTGEIVLLSPACASFDMFTGFEERGNEFKRFVQQLINQK